jgi:nonribosomal peptide synthetase CepC
VALEVGEEDIGAWDAMELPALRTSVEPVGTGAIELDLAFTLTEHRDEDDNPDGIEGALHYAADLFDHDTAESLARRLVRVLEQVAADPGRRVSDLDVFLDDAERGRPVEAPAVWSGSVPPVAADLAEDGPLGALVLDDQLRPVVAGAVGDLYLTGPAVDAGSADRTVGCPFGTEERRMLHTGLLARWSSAAALVVIGERRRPSTSVTTGAGDFDVLLPLRAGGHRPPLYCVHASGGLSWNYAPLLRSLPPNQPVYGVQARGLARTEPLPGSVEEMAADYVEQIRTVQPTGPYHLLGWSLGGRIAQAMAALLEAEGEEVGLLALLDAYPTDVGRLSRVRGNGASQEADEFDKQQEQQVELAAGIARQAGARSNLEEVMRNLRRVGPEHTSQSNGCDILLFVATADRPTHLPTADAIASWQPVTSGTVEPHEIPTSHMEMLQPAALAQIGAIVAEKLRPRPDRERTQR